MRNRLRTVIRSAAWSLALTAGILYFTAWIVDIGHAGVSGDALLHLGAAFFLIAYSAAQLLDDYPKGF